MRFAIPVFLAYLLSASGATAGGTNEDAMTVRQVLFSPQLENQFDRPGSVMVSNDGRDVYVGVRFSAGIAHFDRDPLSGVLTFFSLTPATAPDGSTPANVLHTVITRDGRFLFASLGEASPPGIATFSRDLVTGAITQVSVVPDEPLVFEEFYRPVMLAVSPDGQFLYVYSVHMSFNASLIVARIDPQTGALTVVQQIDADPGVLDGLLPSTGMVMAPDGRQLYIASGDRQVIVAYNRNTITGTLARAGAIELTESASVARPTMSPDGLTVYAADQDRNAVYIMTRGSDGQLTLADTIDLLVGENNKVGIRDATGVTISPDGSRAYFAATVPFGFQELTYVLAYNRNRTTGLLTRAEAIADGVANAFVLFSPGTPAVSPDNRDIYFTAAGSNTIATFNRDRPNLPCADFPTIENEYEAFAVEYSLPEDVDMDGLPDLAMLALVREMSCSGVDDTLDEALTDAYLINRISIETEEEVYLSDDWDSFRHVIPSLLLTSEAMRSYVNQALSGVGLADFYVSLSCIDGNCEPAPARDVVSRAPNEPLSGEGDPDADGFTNAEEWANVAARGGSEREFAVSALDPSNDGSVVVSFEGSGGGCFIATAAYGTPLAAELDRLRTFRDARLLTNTLGGAFADAYYRLSPSAADFIATRPAVRAATRLTILGSPVATAIVGMFLVVLTAAYRTRQRFRRKRLNLVPEFLFGNARAPNALLASDLQRQLSSN